MIARLIGFLLKLLPEKDIKVLMPIVLSTVGTLPLHSTITVDEAGKLLIRGKHLEYDQAILLRESAANVLKSAAWQLVHENTLYVGVSEGFLKAQTDKQVLFGQAAIYFGQQERDLLKVLAGDAGNSSLNGD